jgi:2-polyprenyl-3-methyl-5-hydroxy-6-metoxy-1,4-benzoquinol methylase
MPLDYSRFYATFHSDDPRHRHGLFLLNRRMFLPFLPENRAAPILDVGCGRGYALQDLAALGYINVHGLDTDAGQVAFARGQGLAIEQPDDTVALLNSRPGAYAVVLLMDVLEHLPHNAQPALLGAIVRCLRPGGRLICTVPNAASAIASYWLYNDYTHAWSFTNDSLSYLLKECGFTVCTCTGVEFNPRPRFLFWVPTPRAAVWWLRCGVRFRQRLELIGELGWSRGRNIVLTPNLLAVADKAG